MRNWTHVMRFLIEFASGHTTKLNKYVLKYSYLFILTGLLYAKFCLHLL